MSFGASSRRHLAARPDRAGRALHALVLIGAVAGCEPAKYGGPTDPASRGPQDPVARPEPKAKQAPEPSRPDFDTRDPEPRPAEAPKAEEKAEEKERDLGAELQSALGSPVSCMQTRPADEAPERIVISVNAHVMGSGRVSRANVSASALRPAELDCMRKRAETVRLAGPIDDAPLAISTTIELEQKKPPPP